MLYENYPALNGCKDDITKAFEMMLDTYRNGGKVEIALAREVGAYAVGVASDEEKRFGINDKKLRKLQIAGAEDIIGDYL